MKKNTGCGCNDHKSCPPLSACDRVKAERTDCDNKSFPPDGVMLKTPVLDALVPLAEVDVQALVEADIYLPTPAREIKQIRKNISLKQCRAIPSAFDPKIAKVFITGILHKNIQYVDHTGFVRDFSVDVEFSCNEKVKLWNPVRTPFENFGIDYSVKNSNVFEYRELAKDQHGGNRCVSGSATFETFNEPIQCKLLGTYINELDLYKDFNKFGKFDKVTEKMEILLFLKLSQPQQVPFLQPTPCPPKDGDDDHRSDYKKYMNKKGY
ncbi:hypothetical protein J2S09_000579 [Bacillus fengqiuensis]|nr:hypothetical protein [Bacillus fengqiuensis]